MVIIAKWLLKVGIGPVRAIICTNCAFQSMISVQAAPRFAKSAERMDGAVIAFGGILKMLDIV